jgi:hypothetical protein
MKAKPEEVVFAQKRLRRRQLARLPFERKIEIIIELQKAVSEIRKDPRHVIWKI